MKIIFRNIGKDEVCKEVVYSRVPCNYTAEEVALMEANLHIGTGNLELVPTDGLDAPIARQFVIVHNGIRGVGNIVIV